MALIWAPCAAMGRRRRPLPCRASPPLPGHGGWHSTINNGMWLFLSWTLLGQGGTCGLGLWYY